ncbi:MAG: hypothetical protein AAGG75_00165 [Bacteroidota bacterium]
MIQLTLKYHPQQQRAAAAVFIRGQNPEDWLPIINRWGLPLSKLRAYALPASRQSPEVAGLLLSFPGEEVPEAASWLPAYGWHGPRLCLPVNAQLYPSLSDEELEGLLLYDFQVFHPSIGLVGFAQSDQIDFSDYLLYPLPKEVNWKKAHPGLPLRPKLRNISMPKTPPEELLENLGAEIDQKPLEELPGLDKEENPESLTNKLRRAALRRALGLSDKLNDALDKLPQGQGGGGGDITGPSSPGLLDRFDSWARRQLADLDNQRDKEIRRLMDLFKDNPEEALRYALPLDGKYAGRGKATPSGRLSRRNTDFNLRKLGGGQQVDGWDLGDHYFKLRAMYTDTAKEMIRQKEYRKAAYIYAQLLGDFHAAANVLKQGQFHREAAALYMEHLENKQLAAQCLEEGGLLFEAIELYEELGKSEKVGDLYQQLGDRPKATDAYEAAAKQRVVQMNYLEAARIYEGKLEQPGRAKDMLLLGWQETVKAEECLLHYFKLHEEEEALSLGLKQVYENHTPSYKKNRFLSVLQVLNRGLLSEEIQATSRELAYEIISEQAGRGQYDQLHQLRHFLPKDQLVYSDINRYISQHPVSRPKVKLQNSFQPVRRFNLDGVTRWRNAMNGYDGFLAAGIKNGRLYITRCDWKGNTYTDCMGGPLSHFSVHFLAAPHLGNRMFLYTLLNDQLDAVTLKAGQHFYQDIRVESAHFLPFPNLGCLITSATQISVLTNAGGKAQLEEYSLDGKLLSSHLTAISVNARDRHSTLWTKSDLLAYHNNFYYFIDQGNLIRFSKTIEAETLALKASLHGLYFSPPNTAFRLIVHTNAGCLYFRPTSAHLAPIGQFFATDLNVIGMVFIDEGLAIATREEVHIYDVSNRQTTPELREVVKVGKQEIIAILQAPLRKGFALLFNDGKVSIYQAAAL